MRVVVLVHKSLCREPRQWFPDNINFLNKLGLFVEMEFNELMVLYLDSHSLQQIRQAIFPELGRRRLMNSA